MKAMMLFVVVITLALAFSAVAQDRVEDSQTNSDGVVWTGWINQSDYFTGDSVESGLDIRHDGSEYVEYYFENKHNSVGHVLYRGDLTNVSQLPRWGVTNNWKQYNTPAIAAGVFGETVIGIKQTFSPGETESLVYTKMSCSGRLEPGVYTLVIGLRNEPPEYPGDFRPGSHVRMCFHLWGDRMEPVVDVDIPVPMAEITPPDSLGSTTSPPDSLDSTTPSTEPPAEEETPPAAG